MRLHEGMYTAAEMVCADTQHLVEKFFLPQGYQILVCGHSLGAGVACLLGLFLQSRIHATNPSNLRVLAYATPACLDYETAKAVASFTTSVVNNTDCVARLSVMNLVTMNRLFLEMDATLKARWWQE
jgi:sn1-specific diacylglycerol lipase